MCPVYEYTCTNCDYESEITLPISDRDHFVGEQCINCYKGTWVRKPSKCTFKIYGACAANGYSTDIGNIEKFTGRPYTNDDNSK